MTGFWLGFVIGSAVAWYLMAGVVVVVSARCSPRHGDDEK
jgi:hypothetical protein